MAAPIEFRHYLRRYTLEDVRAGNQVIRLDGECFAAPELQFRYRERSGDMSAWIAVPYVREQPEPVPEPVPAAAA